VRLSQPVFVEAPIERIAPLMKPWAGRQLSEGLASFMAWVESGGC